MGGVASVRSGERGVCGHKAACFTACRRVPTSKPGIDPASFPRATARSHRDLRHLAPEMLVSWSEWEGWRCCRQLEAMRGYASAGGSAGEVAVFLNLGCI